MPFMPPTRTLLEIQTTVKTLTAQELATETRKAADAIGGTQVELIRNDVPIRLATALSAALTAWVVLVLEQQRRINGGHEG